MRLSAVLRACPVWLLLASPLALAHDYPTTSRVLYVHQCMSDNPGPHFEMVNKCSCALDKLAEQMSFSEFEGLSTAANAITIGGERGSYIRENEALQNDARRFRKLQTEARKACFLPR